MCGSASGADAAAVRPRHRRRRPALAGARLVFGPQDRFEKDLGYGVAALEVEGYRPRDEDVYVLYGLPGRMLGRFTLHRDRTLFLFVFATDGAALPQTLDGQKQMLRAPVRRGGWECPRILDALDDSRRPLLRQGQPDPDAGLVAGPGRPGRRRGVLRFADGRPGLRPGHDLGLCARGRLGGRRRPCRPPSGGTKPCCAPTSISSSAAPNDSRPPWRPGHAWGCGSATRSSAPSPFRGWRRSPSAGRSPTGWRADYARPEPRCGCRPPCQGRRDHRGDHHHQPAVARVQLRLRSAGTPSA